MGGGLVYVGDGGDARLLYDAAGWETGDFGGSVARWSPDGQWIAYSRKDGENVELWKSRIDGSAQQQLTQDAVLVRDFFWSEDGARLLYSAEPDWNARIEASKREGSRLEDFRGLFAAANPGYLEPALRADPPIFSVSAAGGESQAADEGSSAQYRRLRSARFSAFAGGAEVDSSKISGAYALPVVNADGQLAWLARLSDAETGQLPMLLLVASMSGQEADAVRCPATACRSQMISKVWWSQDGAEVVYLMTNPAEGNEQAFGILHRQASGALRQGGLRALAVAQGSCLLDADRPLAAC
jgi:dipeptidyl aminopeptidase/acylaminoacyl peptidase